MSKRIIIGIARDGTGGVDNYILKLIHEFKNKNYLVDLIVTNKSFTHLDIWNNSVNKVYYLPSLKSFWGISKKFKNINKLSYYDIAYFNISSAIMFPYVRAARKAKILNVIVHTHGASSDKQTRFLRFIFDLFNKIAKLGLSFWGEKFIACSKKAADWTYLKSVANNCLVIKNPVDVYGSRFILSNRNKYRDELKLNNSFVLGSTSGFRSLKNVEFTIKVFSELQKLNKETKLVLAGSGPLETQLKNLATSFLPKGSYFFIGERNNARKLLSAFDCFIFPSLNESFGIGLVEAQSSDLICFISDGVPEDSIADKSKVKVLPLSLGPKEWASQIENQIYSKIDRNSDKYLLLEKLGYNNKIDDRLFEYIGESTE